MPWKWYRKLVLWIGYEIFKNIVFIVKCWWIDKQLRENWDLYLFKLWNVGIYIYIFLQGYNLY